MPKLSDTMEEGRILRWLRKEGDRVETGQPFAEVETDKATVEMESYSTGTLLKLVTPEGQTATVGALIAVIGTPGEDITALLAEASAAQAPAHPAAPAPAPAPVPSRPAPAGTAPTPAAPPSPAAAIGAAPGLRAVKASPLALRMAAEAGLDVGLIAGSGPQGRVIKRDIEAARGSATALVAQPAPGAFAAPGQPGERPRIIRPLAPREAGVEVKAVDSSMIRRTIARRLVQSKGPIPHFYLTVDVAMDWTWAAYRALRDDKLPISLNDIVIKASAVALRRHPEMNASFGGDHLKLYSRVHIGVAVALDDGLITPIIRDADLKSLEEIAEESKSLAERARARQLQPDEYTGATFSISNLGMFGIEEFSAIINPPEAAILAVGAVRETPVVEDGQVRAGRRMKLTLSVDHRVADGATGARFLATLQRSLENPLLLS